MVLSLTLLLILFFALLYIVMKQKGRGRKLIIIAYLSATFVVFTAMLYINEALTALSRPFFIAAIVAGVYQEKSTLRVSTLRFIVFLLLLLIGLLTLSIDLFFLLHFRKVTCFSNGVFLDFGMAMIFAVMTISRVLLDREFYKPLGALKIACVFLFSILAFWGSGKILDRVRLYSHENIPKTVRCNRPYKLGYWFWTAAVL